MWSLSKQEYPFADSQAQVKRLHEKIPDQAAHVGHRLAYLAEAGYLFAGGGVISRIIWTSSIRTNRTWMLGKTVQQVWPFGL